ncbi:glutathione synthetase [Thiohalorhabdus denitrificans]|uniref:Glutathione synthetase n=1 Tax=Thiohalorhabdus denitrificans TaxID=381306 RepID=A0A0N8PNG7_9GAMM|nr:glutathione synthase [Thiohalorhabdus denitrificans]KPV41477.1 glutathione synthetase [Thiohalorhabdus denitrificans]SCY28853.1 glutathione synthase [Thiohalorhabdus denitrificans]
MPATLGVVMDPIGDIHIGKDTTFAMLLEAQRRGYGLRYMEPGHLFGRDATPWARMYPLEVRREPGSHYTLGDEERRPLTDLDLVLMRKDPPFDMEYIYMTYLLERALGSTLVSNHPGTLRDANEKMFTAYFPGLAPPTLVARDPKEFYAFLQEQETMVLKPLEGRGGEGIFLVRLGDPNFNSVVESLTHRGTRFAMAQGYLPEAAEGDKRIILIDGEPIPHGLLRVPGGGDFRGNISAGATTELADLTERDREICATLGPELRARGLAFVGIDVIGGYVTEINVTSPTGVQELDYYAGINICGDLFDALERRLAQGPPFHALV